MKKNDWFILIATAAYTFLFYEQSAGINFLLFNIVLILLLWFRNKALLTKPAWIVAATGSILSSFFVFKYGTWLPIIANICSLMIVEGFSFNTESSLLISIANSCFSFFASGPRAIKHIFSSNHEDAGSQSVFRKIPLLLIPVFITLVFFFLYREANPVFEKYTDEINWSFISIEWIVFTFIGFVLMFGFFSHQIILWLTQKDQDSTDALKSISLEEHLLTNRMFTVSNELLSGIILFVLLNLLLLSVNALDVYFMWMVKKIPDGITVAQYLHDGTNTLIVSICLAIAVILFVFRGYLNFFEKNLSIWTRFLPNLRVNSNKVN